MDEKDVLLFKEGSHYSLYNTLGAHLNSEGCHFSVWAPEARSVAVIGDFNHWDQHRHILEKRADESGIWELFVPGVKKGNRYKYKIVSPNARYYLDKGDPFAVFWEQPPGNASIVWDLDYTWNEESWKISRNHLNQLDSPISIYEVHLPSWRRVPEDHNRSLTYTELAVYLPRYLTQMGFTHVEFLPVMEHPLFGSWGYQTIGHFAPSSRYGTPQEFMHLIEVLHQAGIGVILDWVPSQFPADLHGLAFFDGTHLYEHSDIRRRFHPDWHTHIFDYDKPEVRSFLISNALFWFEKYHIDALRVDAVASMLYLDYSKGYGEWLPNSYGGRENLGAITFLRTLNTQVYSHYPYAQTIAEESTAWANVSRPIYVGGLGFGMKWNMGWMHDMLKYMSLDPIHRKYHHNDLLFSLHYAFFENFILPLSHDEVVHEKKSLLSKMPGDNWQKFANLRLLLGYMYAHPGKKLLFMGAELGQWSEWNHDSSLDWNLLEHNARKRLQKWVKDLNQVYRNHKALYEIDFNDRGFEWVDAGDWEQSIISFLRKGTKVEDQLLVVCNFTPVPRHHYRIGVPLKGYWQELLNSDSAFYGGSNLGNYGGVYTDLIPIHGRASSISLTLPPLAILVLKPQMNADKHR